MKEVPLLRKASWRALKAEQRKYGWILLEMGIRNRSVMTFTG